MKIKKVLFWAVAVFGLTSCMDWEDLYVRGGADIEARVDRIEIDWNSGLVEIRYHDKPYISVDELYSRSQDLYHYLSGHTLKVRDGNLSTSRSELLVYLPLGSVYEKLDVETSSAKVDADIDSKFINIETNSGKVKLSTSESVKGVDIETGSGDVTLWLPRTTSFILDFNSFSGRLESEFRLTEDFGLWKHGVGQGASINIETYSGNAELLIWE